MDLIKYGIFFECSGYYIFNATLVIGTLENIFTFNGGAGHEIVQVYDASFVDISF